MLMIMRSRRARDHRSVECVTTVCVSLSLSLYRCGIHKDNDTVNLSSTIAGTRREVYIVSNVVHIVPGGDTMRARENVDNTSARAHACVRACVRVYLQLVVGYVAGAVLVEAVEERPEVLHVVVAYGGKYDTGALNTTGLDFSKLHEETSQTLQGFSPKYQRYTTSYHSGAQK